MLAASVAGLLFGLSLIVAIGPQNSYLLQQGARGRHISTAVAICGISDVVLIVVGVAGAGALLTSRPSLLDAVRLAGAALLLAYGALAARRALAHPSGAGGTTGSGGASRAEVIGATLAFTWLNPAVYLDTVVLLGTVANSHPGRQWWFGGGAALGSVLWFVALGFGAQLLAPLLRRPQAARLLDGFVALVMIETAVRVALSAR
jgi:L-lysine exporter family protein LysE/ArgO